MSIAYTCILIAAIMPLVFAAYAKFTSKGYDNAKPREFLDNLEGKSKRAHYAQLNSFEAFPMFAASVIIAHLAAVPPSRITLLAVFFILFRIIYGICYITDKSSLRSAAWFAAFFCILGLFISAIQRS